MEPAQNMLIVKKQNKTKPTTNTGYSSNAQNMFNTK